MNNVDVSFTEEEFDKDYKRIVHDVRLILEGEPLLLSMSALMHNLCVLQAVIFDITETTNEERDQKVQVMCDTIKKIMNDLYEKEEKA